MRATPDYLHLLKTDYNTLLKELQPLLRFAVNEVCTRYSMPDFFDDLLSSVNEELLTHKFDKIKQTYSGETKLTTYVVTVVTNYCKDVVRVEQSRKIRSEAINEDTEIFSDISSDTKALIADEIKRLNFLILLNKFPARLISCLKIFANIELTPQEINDTIAELSKNSPLSTIPTELLYFDENEQQRYTLLANLLSKYDKKDMQGDSLRRWSDRKINDLIRVLNGNPPNKSYTKESIIILIEYFFSSKMSESA